MDPVEDQQQVEPISRSEKSANEARPLGEERVLRAKYLDWCSAQVADHFLALSPGEIFELAQRAAKDRGESGRPLSLSGPENAQDLQSYRALVQQVTEVLWQQLELPSYEEWLELYRADPSAMEEELLGFWREES